MSDLSSIKFNGFVELEKANYLPDCPGVYFVIGDGKVFYIGQSGNLRARFYHHHKSGDFYQLNSPQVFWIEFENDKLKSAERDYIRLFSPPLNDIIRLESQPSDEGYVIEGRLYSSRDLQRLLNVSKQRIYNLSVDRNWSGPESGIYWAECVEPLLRERGIDPDKLMIRRYIEQML